MKSVSPINMQTTQCHQQKGITKSAFSAHRFPQESKCVNSSFFSQSNPPVTHSPACLSPILRPRSVLSASLPLSLLFPPRHSGPCQFCDLDSPEFTDESKLDQHFWQSCPMLSLCQYCQQVFDWGGARVSGSVSHVFWLSLYLLAPPLCMTSLQ
jgi:hypothetical protein